MSSCALCKSMPCCPEHCCNWDECDCSDCDACIAKPEIIPQQPKPILQEPVKIILLNKPLKQTSENDLPPIPEAPESPVLFESKYETRAAALTDLEETKESLPSPKPAGSGVFGIRYLKKTKTDNP